MQHGNATTRWTRRVVATSPLYNPIYDPCVFSGEDGTLGQEYPMWTIPGMEHDTRDLVGVAELFRLVLQGIADETRDAYSCDSDVGSRAIPATAMWEAEAKLVHLFGVTALAARNAARLDGAPWPVATPLWMNTNFWQHVAVFRDEPATLDLLRFLGPNFSKDVGLSAGTDTPLHTALWYQCGAQIVQFLIELQPMWLMVTDRNGLRPLDLVIKHVQEVDLFDCVFQAMPGAAWLNRADTSLQLAAVYWKSKHVLVAMIEHRRMLLVTKKDQVDRQQPTSTARLLFERGKPGKEVLTEVLNVCPHMVVCIDEDGDSLLHTAVNSGDNKLVLVVLSFMLDDRSFVHARRNRNGLLALELCFARSDIMKEVVEHMVLELKEAMKVVYKSLFRLHNEPHVDCGFTFYAAETWLLDRKTEDGYEESLADVGALLTEFQHEDGRVFMTLQTAKEAKKSFADAMLILAREAWSPEPDGSDVVTLCPGKARELIATLVRRRFGNASTPEERWFVGFCAGYCLQAFRPDMRGENGVTLMHIAAAARADINIIDLLERAYHGLDIYCADDLGNTPGHYLFVDPARSKLLSRCMTTTIPVEVFGAEKEPRHVDYFMDLVKIDEHSIFYELDRPHSNVIARMLCSDPRQATAVNTSQFTMLALAVRARISFEDFKLVFRANKDAVRFQGNLMMMTPLHHCVCSFDMDKLAWLAQTTLVKESLSNMLPVNGFRAAVTAFLLDMYPQAARLCDAKGRTPMHLAALTCSPLGIVELLLPYSKTGKTKNPRSGVVSWTSNVLDVKDESGNTPLSIALMQKRHIFKQQDDLVLAMLRDGVCMLFRNQHGLSLYHLVLIQGYVGGDGIENQDDWSVATKLNVERSEQQILLYAAVRHMAIENISGFFESCPNGVNDAIHDVFETCIIAIGASHLETYLKTLKVVVCLILSEYAFANKSEPQLVDIMCARLLARVDSVGQRLVSFYSEHPILPDAIVSDMNTIKTRLMRIRATIEERRADIGKQQAAELADDRMQQELLKTLDDEALAAQETATRNRINRKKKQSRRARAATAAQDAEAGAADPRPPLVSLAALASVSPTV